MTLSPRQVERDEAFLTACFLIGDISNQERSWRTVDRRRIPIVFITAHGDESMKMQALRAGAVEFLAKPFDEDVLLDCVRAAMENRAR